MATSSKTANDRIMRVDAAWKALRPKKKFAGMTHEEFLASVQPSVDLRDKISQAQKQLAALLNQRDDADEASLKVIRNVVNAVKADLEEGENSDIYEAMGFVRRNERKTGLRRARKAVITAIAA